MTNAFSESMIGITSEAGQPAEEGMISRERWEEIRGLFFRERVPIAEIARRMDADRKTVRRCLRDEPWRAYVRRPRAETLLSEHAEWLRERAPQVNYSAQILYQELKQSRGYCGSYDTVKLFVRPLRALRDQAERALLRFETPPGHQSQIDWGEARVYFRQRPQEVHLFVLTLGFSRRSFYCAYPDERLGEFLEAHERAFEHFGGHTREHLYDRPRTVCCPDGEGKLVWNSSFKAFADYWGFEPRLCRPYRAQIKGKVESGVKYVKRNFLPGRTFIDFEDFQAQLDEWNATIADCRIHGTTHEQPIERFSRERESLIPTLGRPSFRLQAPRSRIVAEDYLVSVDTNRYSVPFSLIGQTVEVRSRGELLEFFHRGRLVATHPVLPGKYQLKILPEHGPGAIARNARQRHSSPISMIAQSQQQPEVEVRDLALYDTLIPVAVAEEVRA
jgi:transposase